jgi:hypothetical protein
MKRRKRSARRGRAYKSKPKATARAPSKGAESNRVGSLPDYVFLSNTQDQLAIERLRSNPVGKLPVDLLVRNDPEMAPLLRDALVQVYFTAAQTRELRRATKQQLSKARSALAYLTQALKHLESAGSDGRGGLRMLLEGPLLDDAKGEREVNRFAATCRDIRLEIAPKALELESLIAAESRKPSIRGERQKRLRALVDALGSWWLAGGGRSLAPYVRANRRDGDRAVVHGRSGWFLNLAIALLCGVDVFKTSEVEAAVTNVHEARVITEGKKAAPGD